MPRPHNRRESAPRRGARGSWRPHPYSRKPQGPPTTPIADGLLCIAKPKNVTSSDVCAWVKAQLLDVFWAPRDQAPAAGPTTNPGSGSHEGPFAEQPPGSSKLSQAPKGAQSQLKIGHGGTLDPMATGVLVIGIGHGCKSLQKLLSSTKVYEAQGQIGVETDTLDVTGRALRVSPLNGLTREGLEAVLGQFRGPIQQIPPVFSALRQNGKRMYDLARAGLATAKDMKAREVTVYSLEIVEFDPAPQPSLVAPGIKVEPPMELGQDDSTIATVPVQAPTDPLPVLVQAATDAQAATDSHAVPAQAAIDSTPVPAQADIDPPSALGEAVPGVASVDIAPVAINSVDSQPLSAPADGLTPPAQAPVDSAGAAPLPEPEALTAHPPGPVFTVRIECSSGTYVRSLIRDIGVALGSAATMTALSRTQQGPFFLKEDGLPVTMVERSFAGGRNELSRGPAVGAEIVVTDEAVENVDPLVELISSDSDATSAKPISPACVSPAAAATPAPSPIWSDADKLNERIREGMSRMIPPLSE